MSSSDTPTIARRDVLKGATAMTLATSASLATILADPVLAQAAAATTEMTSITTATGDTVKAAIARPVEGSGPWPAVLMIHEWWGLNDQIRTMAAELAKDGYVVVAVDLYKGSVATTPEQASALMNALDPAAATATLKAWADWLAASPDVQKVGGRAKMATLGWCFGGAWSLNASIAFPVDGTVIYYGRVNRPASDLAALNGPVLGHFATQDQYINRAMVEGFEAEMSAAHKSLEVHWYNADHAFANPTGSHYNADDAVLAWQRTTGFLAKILKG